MRLKELGLDRDVRTVVILGAGATAGAKLNIKPPLSRVFVDSDFFSQLRYFSANSADPEFKKDARSFLAYLAEQYGHGDHGLESIYAELDVTQLFSDTTGARKPGPKSKAFLKRLDQLAGLIVRGMRESFGEALIDLPQCTYHEALVGGLGVDDALISFNYDLLADRALRKTLGAKFDPASSYGFSPSSVNDAWRPPAKNGAPYKNHVRLFKPHGSLHWHKNASGTAIAANEYSLGPKDVAVIPPQYLKRFSEDPFGEVWSGARESLGKARALIVAGYSLPPTDIFTTAALRLEVRNLDLVCVANPDRDARRHTLDVLRSAIRPETVVVEFADFASLATRIGTRGESDPDSNDLRQMLRDYREERRLRGRAPTMEEMVQ